MKKEWILIFGCIIIVVLALSSKEKQYFETREKPKQEISAIYISYIELNKYFNSLTESEISSKIEEMVSNIEKDGFTWIFLHVRSFSDSIYPSKIFPVNYSITRNEKQKLSVDILKIFIEKAHEKSLKVHAWINPYRIRNGIDIGSISFKNPCFKWLGTENVKVIEGTGIFYNPASSEAQELIVQGIKEIVENYDIDGIHLDDYFYPTTSEEIDYSFYKEYLQNGGTLDLDKYRLENINNLVRQIYIKIKEIKENIIFGIAPEGNIENDYQKNYADILTWVSKEGYVDYIMPQLYYGFQNQTKPYITILNDWNNYIKNKDIILIPALGLYKSGNIDNYAKLGINEWIEHNNIVARQIQIARNMSNYGGFAVFRYDNLYDATNETMKLEGQTLREILKN